MKIGSLLAEKLKKSSFLCYIQTPIKWSEVPIFFKIQKFYMVSDFFPHLHAKRPRFYVKVDFRSQIDVKSTSN